MISWDNPKIKKFTIKNKIKKLLENNFDFFFRKFSKTRTDSFGWYFLGIFCSKFLEFSFGKLADISVPSTDQV